MFQKTPTPVKWEKMVPWLEAYPNKAELIVKGLRDAFFVPPPPLPFLGPGCVWVNNLET